MLNSNKINLLARLRENPAMAARRRARARLLRPPAAIVLATLLVECVFFFGIQRALNREYDGLTADLARLQDTYADALILSRQRDALAHENIELARALDAADSYGELGRELFDGVYLAADKSGVSIERLEFTRETGELTLVCTGGKTTSAAEYIVELAGISGVSSAEYGGYAIVRAASPGVKALYRFEVICELGGGDNE